MGAVVDSDKSERQVRDDNFLIVCPARSGSSWLQTMLESHPRLVVHGEVMGPRELHGLNGPIGQLANTDPAFFERMRVLRRRAPIVFIYAYVFATHGREAAGFKFKFDELVLPEYADVVDALVADTDLRIVYLTRRNLLERFVSHRAVGLTGATFTRDGNAPRPPSFRVEPAEVLSDFDQQLEWERHFRSLFGDHPCIDATYEDLTGTEGSDWKRRVQEFLGVRPLELISGLQRMGRPSASDLIENYDEVQRVLLDSPYAHRFEPT